MVEKYILIEIVWIIVYIIIDVREMVDSSILVGFFFLRLNFNLCFSDFFVI